MNEDFDVNSPRGVTTRDGRKVKIYCTDAPSNWPIHGRVIDESLRYVWQKNGRLISDKQENSLDLINPPAPVERIDRKVWVNFYSTENFIVHFSNTSAQSSAHSNCRRIAVRCQLVEIVDGEV